MARKCWNVTRRKVNSLKGCALEEQRDVNTMVVNGALNHVHDDLFLVYNNRPLRKPNVRHMDPFHSSLTFDCDRAIQMLRHARDNITKLGWLVE